MSFKELIWASFLGTFFGFISAVALSVITYFIQRRLANRVFKKHLKREFEYDINLLRNWIDEIEKILRKLAAKDKQIYYYIKYSDLARYFIDESFKLGLIYNLFNNEEVFNLNKLVTHCSLGTEQFINKKVIEYQNCPIAEEDKQQKQLLRDCEYQRDELNKFKIFLEGLLKKIK
ncbi:MAG: hypothetical protein PHH69_05355 [Candidatus Omnitrophica bacterium]|nr:hypothetical protein [Candidatus Omnitrophota bacterium]